MSKVRSPAVAPSPRASDKVFVNRLGVHHFAHLRAVAEGIEVHLAAKRYLGVEHGHQGKTAHQQTVDAVRAVARRAHEPAWRLIGLTIRQVGGKQDTRPSLEEFISNRNLDGWREDEVLEMYQEAYPADRRGARRERLSARQMELLRRLQSVAAETPKHADPVAGWFDDATATKLLNAGMLTLDDLRMRIARGGRWYTALPAIGAGKAQRITSHLWTLIPSTAPAPKPLFALQATPALFAPSNRRGNAGLSAVIAIAASAALPSSLLDARTDHEAVEAWIAARAGSLATVKTYRKEACRLLLWLQYERAGKTLCEMRVEDCRDFMAFLQNIPEKWISREKAAPGQLGWAPFRGPLSHKSCRQAVVIVASLFTWLQNAQYIAANPWALVNQKTGDDKNERLLDTKALSEVALQEVLKFITSEPPSPSRHRALFIFRFMEAVGLRSAELLAAKLGDIRREPEGWVMQVQGKGSKNRIVALPGQAFDALQDYLESRNLGGIESALPHAPLLASVRDSMEPVGYQALYEHVKVWLTKAMRHAALPYSESSKLAKASTHWLRHTFGTRAIARDVPLDVIQAQMGHASIQTTTAIYGRAPMRRKIEELTKAFG